MEKAKMEKGKVKNANLQTVILNLVQDLFKESMKLRTK